MLGNIFFIDLRNIVLDFVIVLVIGSIGLAGVLIPIGSEDAFSANSLEAELGAPYN